MISHLGLIDYGMGNLHSVQQAFRRLGKPIKIVKEPTGLQQCQALILPGVGAFDPAMEHLKRTGLIPYIKDWAMQEKPLLGICLGLQLLFESSAEGSSAGLGLLKGHINHLPTNQGERIPHMGWSLIRSRKKCPLLSETDQSSWMYFVHSYAAIPNEKEDLAATTSFGQIDVTAVVWKGRLGACQFHPEKSANSGKRMLSKWIEWLENGAELQK